MLPDAAGPRIDTSTPQGARIWNYWLGGKDSHEPDRRLADILAAIDPRLPAHASTSAAWANAVAERAAAAGIRQFADLGCGLPVRPYVHEAVASVRDDGRVLYVDRDPVASLYAVNLLAKAPGAAAVKADLRNVEDVLPSGQGAHLDLSRPVCLLLGTVLHILPPAELHEVMQAYIARVAPGSWIAASLLRYEDKAMLRRLRDAYPARQPGLYSHRWEHLGAGFAGTRLIEPGLTEARRWMHGLSEPPPDRGSYVMCGVGIKP